MPLDTDDICEGPIGGRHQTTDRLLLEAGLTILLSHVGFSALAIVSLATGFNLRISPVEMPVAVLMTIIAWAIACRVLYRSGRPTSPSNPVKDPSP